MSDGHAMLDGLPGSTEDHAVSNYPFSHPVTRLNLDRHGLEDLLRSFEDTWAADHDERITSAQFYDRYKADAVPDSMFTTAWASYYEIFRRLGDAGHRDLVDTLVAAG
jgi:hypothetical protein